MTTPITPNTLERRIAIAKSIGGSYDFSQRYLDEIELAAYSPKQIARYDRWGYPRLYPQKAKYYRLYSSFDSRGEGTLMGLCRLCGKELDPSGVLAHHDSVNCQRIRQKRFIDSEEDAIPANPPWYNPPGTQPLNTSVWVDSINDRTDLGGE